MVGREHPTGTRSESWTPVGPTETALLAALIAEDEAAYTAALVTASLLLPVTEEAAEGREPARWVTHNIGGVTYLLTFTSPEAIAAAFPGIDVRYRVTDFFDLVAHWPNPEWRMAVDPGLPIATQLTSEVLRSLAEAGPPRPPHPDHLTPAEEDLWAALQEGDSPTFMSGLIRQPLLLPIPPRGGLSRDLTDPEFPWWQAESEIGEPGVPVFTSERMMISVLGEQDFIEVSVPYLVENWPDQTWYLMINPNTGLATRLTGTQAKNLGKWIADLRDAANEDIAEHNQQMSEDQPIGAPNGTIDPIDPSGHIDPADAADAADDSDEDLLDPTLPIVLQLVIPPAYLSSYLDQGYHRAAGLVHASRGSGRDTPARLYRRLGLLGSGSPFSASDEWVAVLRWSPDAETPEEWGRGEPRMESVLIPDGAEIHRILANRTEEPLARFDGAARQWQPLG